MKDVDWWRRLTAGGGELVDEVDWWRRLTGIED